MLFREIACLRHSKKIIVHASPVSTNALIESCGNIRTMTKDIYAPEVGESIQIGQQTNSFSISISDELLAALNMSRVRVDVFVTGVLSILATV